MEETQHSPCLGFLSCETPVLLTQHNQLFQESPSKGHLVSVPGMLAGVLAVLGPIQQPSAARCAKGDREVRPWHSCLFLVELWGWQCQCGSWEMGSSTWGMAGKDGAALAQGWRSTALREGGWEVCGRKQTCTFSVLQPLEQMAGGAGSRAAVTLADPPCSPGL